MSVKVIRTSYGALRGIEKVSRYDGTKYWSYQGVPYAKPPIGDLRFKSPEQLEPWVGIRDALKEGNRPPQYDMFTGKFIGNEDCLYLNVYVPQSPVETSLPVMVWIHGGGFAYGHADADLYGPEFLMNKAIILVTINYRIGILGFLNLESKEATGNMGLKDQNSALQWVNKEIEHFGGDSRNVTLFGESAGGASVHFHMMSSMSKGLFHKAIIMSGSALCDWAFTKNHLQRAFDLGKLLGCVTENKHDLTKFLLSVSPETFARLQDKVINQEEHLGGTDQAFVPTVDGEFLTVEPLEILRNGNILDVPTIIGVTSDEGFLMGFSLKRNPLFVDDLNKKLEVSVPYPFKKSPEMGEELRRVYFGNDSPLSFEMHSAELYKLYGHTLFLLPIVLSLNNMLNQPSRQCPVYFYRFSYDGPLGWLKNLMWGKDTTKPAGVSHCDELGYLLSNDLVDYNATADNNDKAMVNQFTKLWTDFAKTGKPISSKSSLIEWLPVKDVQNMDYLDIAGPSLLKMKQSLDKEKIDFWMNKM